MKATLLAVTAPFSVTVPAAPPVPNTASSAWVQFWLSKPVLTLCQLLPPPAVHVPDPSWAPAVPPLASNCQPITCAPVRDWT